MKSKKNLIENLKPLPYFTKAVLVQIAEQYALEDVTIDTYISRYIKSKDIIQLRRELYVSKDFYEKNKNDVTYLYYLANVLRKPSYISSWTALQYYSLATEEIGAITSVTQKVTRDYQTKIGTFFYKSINEKSFSDYVFVKGNSESDNKFDFYIASPSKALFDLLYFRTNRYRSIEVRDIGNLLEELRIDFDEMGKKEQDLFYSMVERYKEHE